MASPTLQFKRGAAGTIAAGIVSFRAGEPGFTTDKHDFYIGLDGTSGNNKFFGSARYWTRENGADSAVLKLVDASGTNGVSLRSPQNAGAGVTYTLPGPGGTTGHFLKLAADGVLEWTSVTSGATFDGATLSNTTFTGISTFSGLVDANAGLDVTGHSELDNLNVSGVGTIATADINGGNIDGTVIGGSSAAAGTFTQLNYDNSSTSGISTVGSLYVGGTKVLSVEGGDLTLSNIVEIDATTKSTLESVLSLDPNDFNSLNVSGIATVGGDFYANGNVSIGNSTSDTLTVDAAATFNQLITGDISGNAGTATALQTARNIAVSGIVTGTASFDGTSDITIATTIQNDVVGLGTHTYGDYVKTLTAGAGLTGDGTGEGSTPTLAVGAGTGITVNANDVALKNSGELTNNRLLKWDSTGGQLSNSAITDDGSNVTVAVPLIVTGNTTVNGNLTVNGTTTQVNTTEIAVYDRTITLGIQTGTTPTTTTWDLGVLMNYGDAGVAKTAGFVWDFQTQRFQFASDASNPASGDNTTTPDITVSSFAPIEVGGLYVNNACTGGSVKEVVGCANGELNLMNVVVDGGLFV